MWSCERRIFFFEGEVRRFGKGTVLTPLNQVSKMINHFLIFLKQQRTNIISGQYRNRALDLN